MIIKPQDLKKIDLNDFNKFLFYGKNEGLKNIKINEIITQIEKENVLKYDENQILNNPNIFLENALANSLFSKKKIIMVQRCTDKILEIINEIIISEIKDLLIILNSDVLEKRSKLRSLFEKDKNLICAAFYPDNHEILYRLTQNFLKEKKISISQSNVNLLIDRCGGDRVNLNMELEKIELYLKNKKKISTEEIFKITNLSENYSFTELIDNTLAKNQKRIMRIISDNNFYNEDGIILVKTMLIKLKKLLNLTEQFISNKDLNKTILQAKPPIFWKDKDIVKKQISLWKPDKIKKMIFHLNNIELQIKKNSLNAINIILDFLIQVASSTELNN